MLPSQSRFLIFKLVLVVVGIHSYVLDLELVRLGSWGAAVSWRVLDKWRIA